MPSTSLPSAEPAGQDTNLSTIRPSIPEGDALCEYLPRGLLWLPREGKVVRGEKECGIVNHLKQDRLPGKQDRLQGKQDR